MSAGEVSPEEFADLFRDHSRQVHAYLRRRAPHDSEDLLSDVFIVAWRRRRDLPAAELHRAWLYGVARTLLRAHLRKNRTPYPTDAERNPTQFAAAPALDSRGAIVRRALDDLPATSRELIQLTTWEHLSVTEAALSLGIRPGTARVRLHRARRQLADHPELQALVSTVIHDTAAHNEFGVSH